MLRVALLLKTRNFFKNGPVLQCQIHGTRSLHIGFSPTSDLVVSALVGAPADFGDPTRCRPIGCYVATAHLAARYMEDR